MGDLAVKAGKAGAPVKVIDWLQVARLVREHMPTAMYAGLKEDKENTYCRVWSKESGPDSKVDGCLASNWATPCVWLETITIDKPIDCFKIMTAPNEAKDAWPHSALKLLFEGE